MFKPQRAAATLPAEDLQRAKAFYRDKLGLSPTMEDDALGLIYELPSGSSFGVFPSSGKPSGTHTQLAIEVDDVEGTVKDLQSKGVKFEDYDTPGLKTVNGIADFAGSKGAWFKDSEGNLIALGVPVAVLARSRA
jgi:catechol 2,3-dioxygenase-like lactoylglutathione lyase family enzyme